MPKYIKHKFLKPLKVLWRDFQVELAVDASHESTLVVIPTGLGKTVIAALTALPRLEKGKVLHLAPTNPLVAQHEQWFNEFLEGVEVTLLNGKVKPQDRGEAFQRDEERRPRIIVATPQTVANDLKNGRISLEDVSLVIYDEAHHGVGDYAYTYIAEMYEEQRPVDALSLGITASPGHTEEKVKDLCAALRLETIRYKTDKDDDVAPYTHDAPVSVYKVSLEPEMRQAEEILHGMYCESLDHVGLPHSVKYGDLLAAQAQARGQGNRLSMFWLARVMKLRQAKLNATTQGPAPLRAYLMGLRSDKSKAARSILEDYRIDQVIDLTTRIRISAKQEALIALLTEQLTANPESKVIIFCSYRSTIDAVHAFLSWAAEVLPYPLAPGVLVGQSKGMTQKKQRASLEAFRGGQTNVLITTQVGEEGLDIPSVDLVIAHEPVGSGKRSIQRGGRTGRSRAGRVAVIVTVGTMDEWSLINSARTKSSMYEVLAGLGGDLLRL